MSDVNDRGTMKWTSLMLPEQVKMLQQLRKEQEYKTKPILDEQQINENLFHLETAIQNDLLVTIKYFADYDFHFVKGMVGKVDVQNQKVRLHSDSELDLFFKDIIAVFID